MRARLLDLARAMEPHADPAGFAGREQVERQPLARRRSEEQVVPAVSVNRDGLRLLPHRLAALAVAIDGDGHGLGRGKRETVSRVERAAEPDESGHWGKRSGSRGGVAARAVR